MEFDFEQRLREVVEEVGRKAFHSIYKVTADGLPPDEEPGIELWHSDTVSEMLDDADTQKVASLALSIEEEAFRAILRLFTSPGFLEQLKKDMIGANAKELVSARKRRHTEVYEEYMKDRPSKSTKQILKEMESKGLIESEGDYYLTVQVGEPRENWPKLVHSTMASKLSRIRKQLQNE